MKFRFLFIIGCLGSILTTQAQSLRLKDRATHQVLLYTDTTLVQSMYNGGWVGAESLDMSIIVENISNRTIEIGARKIEYEKLQADVEHTICFAGQCYDVGTYESPFHITLNPGQSDSGFIAHYLFDNTKHIRGINHIAYSFYDVNMPNDTAVAFVTYNTNVANVSVGAPVTKPMISFYPNPTKDYITIHSANPMISTITIYNLLGEKTLQTNFTQTMSIQVTQWEKGIYILSCEGLNYKLFVD